MPRASRPYRRFFLRPEKSVLLSSLADCPRRDGTGVGDLPRFRALCAHLPRALSAFADGVPGAYSAAVFDEPAQLRQKAEACRRLADMSEDAARKALWLERADHWEQLAVKAAKQPRPRTRAET